ncbi:hypothetical protein K432DRAFT_385899 [Lepidopterella palustris CBS 459.81]|uniref:HCNGP-domain-containing protein n=1 Tax=Lepidopterella palustris CBS 459.81 TaxID=1314670 RepID=A0A8E2E253_9PEZI|nr:hypothetical protein K432DRAFT_385899 [Lepidopterella palustris CBS 459.81]
MLGLNYESSDDEVAVPIKSRTSTNNQQTTAVPDPKLDIASEYTNPPRCSSLQRGPFEVPPSNEPAIGPALGPSATPPPAEPSPVEGNSAAQSPYSSARIIIRNLTLPPVPNFNIPPSPPASPPPKSTAKFRQFLELKRRGVHFNERLEKTSALRNPSHLQKLMGFAGLSDMDQYASTLPEEVAVPTSFPEWADAKQLAMTQKGITKRREEEQARTQREAIDFVPAAGSAASSRTATPGGRGSRGSAAERVMAGLDREKPGPPLVPDRSKRREFERKGSRFDDSRSRYRSRSRSPKRKRSRSR